MSGHIIYKGKKISFSVFGKPQILGLNAIDEFLTDWFSGKAQFTLNTSGSTGTPKPIQISRQQMISSAQRTAKALDLAEGANALLCINPAYIGGKMMLVRSIIHNWNLTVIEQTADPSKNIESSAHFEFAAMVPLQLERLLSNEKGIKLLNNIDKIIVGGAPISKSLEEKIQSLNCQVYSTYGMTETVSHIALKTMNGPDKCDEFEVLEGIEVDTDERGCLKIKGDITNYKWVQTNDIVELNDKQFKWIGRADYVINSGGIKIHLDQLELTISEALNTTTVLLKRSHPQLGETFVAVIEGVSDKTPKTILSMLEGLLPKYHKPNAIFQVQTIPKTASGKIDRLGLAKQLDIN